MKKATLTIGLFSLVMVTTSFTTPETLNNIGNEELSIISPIDGVGARDGRQKHDYVGTETQADINYNQSSNLNADRQSLRMTVKLD
ncbi:hypothetical protein IRZ71_12600 [Flavobacterium sp. ANB]|uniref:hypothetical protein n=1 Tax=unclassified Flavobacterium TaxID=196869 RepID=UPI001889EED3|nr:MULTISPECIES: hypothetical protein [unclassified Flavobacterium]MBF4517195.1 hypothetical protein [Flavobacterium sp. ANB]